MKHINFRSVTITLISILGIVSLALSYDALYLVASKHGHTGWRAYAWPTLIDLPLIVLTSVMLYAQTRRMGGWTIAGLLGLVLAYTGATIYLNYLESDGSIEGIFVRVSAPVGLFVCTEVLRHLLKFEIERGAKVVSLPQLTAQLETAQSDLDQLNREADQKRQQAHAELEQLTGQRNTLAQQIEQSKDELTQVKAQIQEEINTQKPADVSDETKAEAFKVLAQWEAEGISLNRKGAALARELSQRVGRKVGRKTGLNLLNEYQEMGTDSPKNGNGTQKQGSFGRVVDALPVDETGKDALKKSAENFQNGQQGSAA